MKIKYVKEKYMLPVILPVILGDSGLEAGPSQLE